MAVSPKTKLFSLLGFVAWGDLGPLSFYRRPDGRLVTFAKTYPDKAPSPKQIEQRAKFKAAATSWRSLPEELRQEWRRAAARASLCATGYDLWMYCHLSQQYQVIETIARQTGTYLVGCPACDSSSSSSGPPAF